MATEITKPRNLEIRGLILPREGKSLKPLWRAFEAGSTWHRIGKRRRTGIRLGHTAYRGRLHMEWWGKAIRYSVRDGDGSGKIAGAFLGHAQRHGMDAIDRMDMSF